VPPAPSAGPCPHRCNRDWRKAVEDYDKAVAAWAAAGYRGQEPAPVEIEPWPGEPILCRRCTATVRAALRELPRAYDALAAVPFLTRSASAGEERRGRSDVPASPSPGADHQDEILRLAREWEDAVRKHLGHAAATDAFGRPTATLAAAVEYLNANYTALLEWERDPVEEFARDIERAFSTAVAMVKNKPVRKHLPVPCPTCDTLSLIQEEGIAGKPWYVECVERAGGCGRLFTESEYSWLTQLITDGHVPTAAAA
jgi:hypothetical protein